MVLVSGLLETSHGVQASVPASRMMERGWGHGCTVPERAVLRVLQVRVLRDKLEGMRKTLDERRSDLTAYKVGGGTQSLLWAVTLHRGVLHAAPSHV